VEVEDSIFAIFEKDEVSEVKISNGSSFAILDEILTQKKIVDTAIDERCITMFSQNPELSTMKDSENNPIKNPLAVYPCKKTGAVYENINKQTTSEPETEDTDVMIHHDEFGDVYLFSTEPIHTVGSFFSFFTGPKPVKRCALFLEKEITIENGIKPIQDFLKEEKEKENLPDYTENTCISFQEAGKQFWAVKSKLLFTEI
jgi:hypothetical protein